MNTSEHISADDIEAIRLAAKPVGSAELEVVLSVPDIRCAGCIQKIEGALMATSGVSMARVNLTARRVRVRWDSGSEPPPLTDILKKTGFSARLAELDPDDTGDDELSKQVRALAVAGFAAGNVMMLSWSVWSGADDKTRHLFHLLSAIITIPALVFSSRLFFTSAWRALRHGTTNMDVPICVGIVLTTLLSIYDTFAGGHQVYFDAAIMLVFFLLIGRTLDTRMRVRARDAMGALKQMQPMVANVVLPQDGITVARSIEDVMPGDQLRVDAGTRIPLDCRVINGTSAIDMSIVTGESVPIDVDRGAQLYSGCMNIDGPLLVEAIDDVQGSYLSRIEQEMSQADHEKGQYHQLADSVVAYYTPFVHLAALVGFLGWLWATQDWYQSVTVGVAILIITCPCALGLAVPIARVIAGQQLLKRGVLMKNGQALEQLALVDAAVFDKTGTLTTSQASLNTQASAFDEQAFHLAQSLSHASDHPYARAIANATLSSDSVAPPASAKAEFRPEALRPVPGAGIEAVHDGVVYRLGSEAWALNQHQSSQIHHNRAQAAPLQLDDESHTPQPTSVLSRDGQFLARFAFDDSLRQDAVSCVQQMKALNISVSIVSGDQQSVVTSVAETLGVNDYQSAIKPWDKVSDIRSRLLKNNAVVMIGDGVNDSPALTAATVSIVPGTAANMTRRIGDFILLADRLTAIPEAIAIARRSRRIMKQNLGFAVGYNVIALPLAMAGYVTPLVAALAMSMSSALVVANSLRLARIRGALDRAQVSREEQNSRNPMPAVSGPYTA